MCQLAENSVKITSVIAKLRPQYRIERVCSEIFRWKLPVWNLEHRELCNCAHCREGIHWLNLNEGQQAFRAPEVVANWLTKVSSGAIQRYIMSHVLVNESVKLENKLPESFLRAISSNKARDSWAKIAEFNRAFMEYSPTVVYKSFVSDSILISARFRIFRT